MTAVIMMLPTMLNPHSPFRKGAPGARRELPQLEVHASETPSSKTWGRELAQWLGVGMMAAAAAGAVVLKYWLYALNHHLG